MPTDLFPPTLGLIPARGGSKGVLRKNIRLLAGKPLIAHTIIAAQASRYLSTWVTTTEDEDIAKLARQWKSPVLTRPADLAGDAVSMLPVALHALDTLQSRGSSFEYFVLLQPTAPLRTAADIDSCLEILNASGADSVVSVSPIPGHFHPDWQFIIREDGQLQLYNGLPFNRIIPRRQELFPTYTRNGAIYACRIETILRYGNFYGSNVQAYQMPSERSVNIDSELDLLLAELLLTSTTTSRSY